MHILCQRIACTDGPQWSSFTSMGRRIATRPNTHALASLNTPALGLLVAICRNIQACMGVRVRIKNSDMHV